MEYLGPKCKHPGLKECWNVAAIDNRRLLQFFHCREITFTVPEVIRHLNRSHSAATQLLMDVNVALTIIWEMFAVKTTSHNSFELIGPFAQKGDISIWILSEASLISGQKRIDISFAFAYRTGSGHKLHVQSLPFRRVVTCSTFMAHKTRLKQNINEIH